MSNLSPLFVRNLLIPIVFSIGEDGFFSMRENLRKYSA
jgi:ABC-type uncharacterized transport system permease subunit